MRALAVPVQVAETQKDCLAYGKASYILHLNPEDNVGYVAKPLNADVVEPHDDHVLKLSLTDAFRVTVLP